MDRFAEITEFASAAGLKLAFGLNMKSTDPTNLIDFVTEVARRNLSVDTWEMGNELGIGQILQNGGKINDALQALYSGNPSVSEPCRCFPLHPRTEKLTRTNRHGPVPLSRPSVRLLPGAEPPAGADGAAVGPAVPRAKVVAPSQAALRSLAAAEDAAAAIAHPLST